MTPKAGMRCQYSLDQLPAAGPLFPIIMSLCVVLTGFSVLNSTIPGDPCCKTAVKTVRAAQGIESLQHGHSDTLKQKRSRELFDRLKKLEGEWKGKSTKGWEDVMKITVIANGSTILFNSFDAHPNETMLTLMHLDLDRLLLTHYCVAGSQPRLEATSVEEDDRKITFTFLDATNLPSRNKGHMDKLIMRLIDDDHFTAQWTWYQEGRESWMEEIRRERVGKSRSTD